MEKTKEEWARQHLAQVGNHDPKPESIQLYIDMITPGSYVYNNSEQGMSLWLLRNYKAWVARDEELAKDLYEMDQASTAGRTLAELYNDDE